MIIHTGGLLLFFVIYLYITTQCKPDVIFIIIKGYRIQQRCLFYTSDQINRKPQSLGSLKIYTHTHDEGGGVPFCLNFIIFVPVPPLLFSLNAFITFTQHTNKTKRTSDCYGNKGARRYYFTKFSYLQQYSNYSNNGEH